MNCLWFFLALFSFSLFFLIVVYINLWKKWKFVGWKGYLTNELKRTQLHILYCEHEEFIHVYTHSTTTIHKQNMTMMTPARHCVKIDVVWVESSFSFPTPSHLLALILFHNAIIFFIFHITLFTFIFFLTDRHIYVRKNLEKYFFQQKRKIIKMIEQPTQHNKKLKKGDKKNSYIRGWKIHLNICNSIATFLSSHFHFDYRLQ